MEEGKVEEGEVEEGEVEEDEVEEGDAEESEVTVCEVGEVREEAESWEEGGVEGTVCSWGPSLGDPSEGRGGTHETHVHVYMYVYMYMYMYAHDEKCLESF